MKTITVKLKNCKYNIYLKKNLLKEKFLIDKILSFSKSIVIITHKSIEDLYPKKLFERLKKQAYKIRLISFEDGEKNKSFKTLAFLQNEMLKESFGRDTLIIAIGGGIVSDIAGFLAATYMRGISYISIPTTLLAIVDASIGGKVAVNCSFGKNLIGSFYHPQAIFIDFEVLKTLPEDELKNGLAEMLKHALISSKKAFLDLLTSNEITFKQIIDSIKIKKKIVEKDEKEKNIRKKLNFAHTIAHSLEALLNYNISHGEAISVGILIESFISYKKKLLPLRDFEQILYFLKIKKLPCNIPDVSNDQIISYIKIDKKNTFDKNQFTLLKKIGKSIINVEILKSDIIKWLILCREVKYVDSYHNRSRSFFSKKTD
jgi:3-dehydroquinate synthase